MERFGFAHHLLFLQFLLQFLFLFLVLDASMATTSPPPSPQLNKTQEQIMRNVSRTLSTTKWDTSNLNPCSWSGVSCSSSSNSSAVVTSLSFSGFGLSMPSNSTFFAYLCLLDTLQYLDLSLNYMTDLPGKFFTSGCAARAGMKSLNFNSNRLTRQLQDFFGFPQLEVLDLSHNSLVGNVSAHLGFLPKLRSLNLSSNTLLGSIPTSIGSGGGAAHTLEELVLSSNQFSGQIPSGLFGYESLTVLDLSQNNLTGTVPDEFLKLPKLRILLLSVNDLGGAIPGSLLNVVTLSRFAANQNNFSSLIPIGITKHVRMLDLSYNRLRGEIPSDLLLPPSLETIDLTGNQLEGNIPGNLSSSLYRLRLGGNKLNGHIPGSIGNVLSLVYLELDDNQLEGVIPQELGKCKDLTLLNLAMNKLQGGVLKQLGDLQNLVVLKLQMNSLDGEIPSELSTLASLSTLNLSQNVLTGEIPSGIFKLQKLSNLNLQGNKISGQIPNSINSLNYLMELELGNNELTGTIPTMPTSLTIALNLSHNHFSGPIPSNLGNLVDLEILDLSYNNFSGEVPSTLRNLQSLTQLVLSYNQLSGALPNFPRWVKVDTTGNSGLATPAQNNTTSSKRRRSTVLSIILAIVGTFVGLGLVAAFIMFSLSKRFYRVKDEGPPAEESVPQIINGHFITMNSIHTSAIEFIKAMEAVSNHNNVFLKTRFCTYYKAVMPNGATYSVKKLNWSDKIFQIGSQDKFGHELKVLGKLSNSNVMVPLAYVLTEDSAYLFYEHVYKGTVFDFLYDGGSNVLDWPSRYSIALGVAQGLTFLHGHTQPVLLLDLATRTIHLKSLNEPQIADIELYKIIDPSKSSGSLSTVAGTVGYIPPEYAYTMRLTMSGNVYSFGVVLLELLTGKRSVSDGIELAKWALSFSARPDQREQILDARVSRTSLGVRSQMLSVLNIALACVAFSPDARPKMRNVLRMLFNAK